MLPQQKPAPGDIIEASDEAFTTGLVTVTEVEAEDSRLTSVGTTVMDTVGFRTVAVLASVTVTDLGITDLGITVVAVGTDDACRL